MVQHPAYLRTNSRRWVQLPAARLHRLLCMYFFYSQNQRITRVYKNSTEYETFHLHICQIELYFKFTLLLTNIIFNSQYKCEYGEQCRHRGAHGRGMDLRPERAALLYLQPSLLRRYGGL